VDANALIEPQIQATPDGAVLFDAGLPVRPQPAWLDPGHWAAETVAGGRGGVVFAYPPIGDAVLRHYHRGGLVARFSTDTYLWTGAERTRAFREFRLLARLANAGLPVPAPIVAGYARHGTRYTANLLMRRIGAVQTLAGRLAARELDEPALESVGRTIARFHALGVVHADLNAHNVLLDADTRTWLIDFDRGRLRRPDFAWQQAGLARLRRSLDKLGANQLYPDFDNRCWHPLLAAYHAQLATAAATDGAK
jgi:3-deoxy-D-manno-octulosonic acid kinase